MLLRVQYQNFDYDYVDAATLDGLIVSKRITKFLRPSEAFWVNIGRGPVRRAGGIYMNTVYVGPERRQIPPAT
jgi:hypothetical protein